MILVSTGRSDVRSMLLTTIWSVGRSIGTVASREMSKIVEDRFAKSEVLSGKSISDDCTVAMSGIGNGGKVDS